MFGYAIERCLHENAITWHTISFNFVFFYCLSMLSIIFKVISWGILFSCNWEGSGSQIGKCPVPIENGFVYRTHLKKKRKTLVSEVNNSYFKTCWSEFLDFPIENAIVAEGELHLQCIEVADKHVLTHPNGDCVYTVGAKDVFSPSGTLVKLDLQLMCTKNALTKVVWLKYIWNINYYCVSVLQYIV